MALDDLRDYGDDPYVAGTLERRAAAELERGEAETRDAQAAGPAGSAARDAAYRELEARWAREGADE